MPEEIDDEFEAFRDLLPEGAMPEQGIRAVAYMDKDGELAWGWQTYGDSPMTAAWGLMSMATADWQHRYLHRHADPPGPDDPED
jgi:hypothetical protein